MGVNAAGLGLLALARESGADFSKVITVGRQRVNVSPDDLDHFFRERQRADIADAIAGALSDGYCEDLLKIAFGAKAVQSLDASDYEGAAIVHDMNTPLTPPERYSVVLDFGTLEHVFNVPVAFDNVAALCAPGAHILHMLPSNNLSGHGFYQFSPELFFQIYAPERGFTGTRVFAAPSGAPDMWYEVSAPRELKKRVDITSRDQLYLLVLTQKTGETVPLAQKPVQQSDYVELWTELRQTTTQARRGALARMIRTAFGPIRHRMKVARKDVTGVRSDMKPRRVIDLTPMAARIQAHATAAAFALYGAAGQLTDLI